MRKKFEERVVEPGTKVCRKCLTRFPLEQFPKQARHKSDGRASWCKACHRVLKAAWCKRHPEKMREYHRKYRAADPERAREKWRTWARENRGLPPEVLRERASRGAWRKTVDGRKERHLRQRHRLSLADYTQMLALQGGVCAICGSLPGSRGLYVDHDHATRMVRALLCTQCNFGIGHFRDDPERLRQAAAYIERHRASTQSPMECPSSSNSASI